LCYTICYKNPTLITLEVNWMSFTLTPGLVVSTLCFFIPKHKDGSFHILNTEVRVNQNGLTLCLLRLMKSNHSAYTTSSFSSSVSRFKNCTHRYLSEIPVHDPAYIDSYYRRITSEYHTLLNEMHDIVTSLLKTDDESISRLTRILLEALSKDKSLPDDTVLYALPTGSEITRKSLVRQNSINLPAFLIGVWYYACSNHPDNTLGREALEKWLWENDKLASRPGNLRQNVGTKITRAINIQINTPAILKSNEKADSDTIVSYADPALLQRFAEYLESLSNEYSKIQTVIYSDYKSDVEAIYIPTSLRKADVSESAPDDLALIKVPSRQAIRVYSRTVLLSGSGGVGKSIDMQHLLLHGIEEFRMTGEYLPLFLQLRNYNKKYSSLAEFIYSQNEAVWDYSPQKLQFYLQRHTTLILLDGMDEISGDEILKNYSENLRHFVKLYTKPQVIVSSRNMPRMYYLTGGFKKLYVQLLSPDQAVALIQKLNFRPDRPEITSNFIAKLRSDYFTKHLPLSGIPLMLTIMLRVYAQHASVPSEMYELYKRLFEVMEHEFDATKNDYKRPKKSGLAYEDFRRILEELGARLYEADMVSFTRDQLDRALHTMEYVSDYSRRTGRTVNTDDFIHDMLYCLCLFTCERPGTFAMIHPSFREYFFASYLERSADDTLVWAGKLIDSRGSKVTDDNALSMLYAVRKNQVERYIFLPMLQELFAHCGQNDGCLTYLREKYVTVSYVIGKIKGDNYNITKSPILNFILKTRNLHKELNGDCVNNPQDWFLEITYYEKEGKKYEGQLFEKDELVVKNKNMVYYDRIAEIPSEEFYEDSPSEVGRVYVIDMEQINPTEYRSLYESVVGEKSPYYHEYVGLYKYMKEIEAAKAKSRHSQFPAWI